MIFVISRSLVLKSFEKAGLPVKVIRTYTCCCEEEIFYQANHSSGQILHQCVQMFMVHWIPITATFQPATFARGDLMLKLESPDSPHKNCILVLTSRSNPLWWTRVMKRLTIGGPFFWWLNHFITLMKTQNSSVGMLFCASYLCVTIDVYFYCMRSYARCMAANIDDKMFQPCRFVDNDVTHCSLRLKKIAE